MVTGTFLPVKFMLQKVQEIFSDNTHRERFNDTVRRHQQASSSVVSF